MVQTSSDALAKGAIRVGATPLLHQLALGLQVRPSQRSPHDLGNCVPMLHAAVVGSTQLRSQLQSILNVLRKTSLADVFSWRMVVFPADGIISLRMYLLKKFLGRVIIYADFSGGWHYFLADVWR